MLFVHNKTPKVFCLTFGVHVTFYRAIESLAGVKDNNLIGLLYSKVANTYTKTMDYAQASSFIEKSLDSFHSCGRKDQESLMLLHKASNLLQRRLWEEARDCYQDILSRNPMDPRIKRIAAMDYAVLLLTQPQPDEDLALSLMDNALKEGATFGSTSHLYAYIYLLKSRGRDKESEIYEKLASQEYEKDTYSSTYWKYRQELKSGNKDNAYRSLWTAMNVMDSIRMSSYELSAANAQRAYIEQTEAERILRAQDQQRKNIITSLLCLVLGLVSVVIYLLYQKALQKKKEEEERMSQVIENLENKIIDSNKTNRQRAVFAFLGEVYEDAYLRQSSGGIATENLSKAIQSKIGDLKSDSEAQRSFEELVDKKMDGIMSRLRKDCPDLSENDYRMSSYYFAGFDNTTVMIIMGIPSLEATRSRKRYLRKKMTSKYGAIGEYYSSIIGDR